MKTEIIETDDYPYAMIENVFNEHELIDVLDFVKDIHCGDLRLDSSYGDLEHMLQQKAWDIHDALYDDMKEKTVNPINPHVKEEGRNSFFRIQAKRLEPRFEEILSIVIMDGSNLLLLYTCQMKAMVHIFIKRKIRLHTIKLYHL